MKICIICKGSIENCPPLLRLLCFLCSKGWAADVFCAGGDGALPEIVQGISMDECVGIVRVKEARGVFRKVRPAVEVPRLAAALRSANTGDWDLVITYNPYALLAGCLAGLGKKEPLVYYSAELFDARKFWPQRLCERLGRGRIRGLIICQEDRGQLLKQRLRLDVPAVVIPNSCFDYHPIVARENQNVKRFDQSPVVFVYKGANHLDRRCLCELVQVFGNIDADVLLRLALIGNSKNTEYLKGLIAQTRYPNHFEFVDCVPYPQHFATTYQCGVGIMLYHRDISLNYRYCAPNKLYEYAMLGLPVISSDQPHLRREIEENGFGLCVDPKNCDALAVAVTQMTNPERLQEMSRRARQWYEKFGRYELAASRLEDWCNTLISK
jgi:hypothetical protein